MMVVIIATLCSISILHFVFVEPENKTTEYLLNLFYFNKLENGVLIESKLQIGLILISSIIMGLSIFILMGYKNRVKQMKFTLLNLLAIVALVLAFFTKAYMYVPEFSSEKLMLPSMVGMTLLIFLIYLNIRVYNLIKKDEELVKSADRLR
jgi:glucan phosphoethanolaminetransferase (alkaline phosphatase superfamily)